MTLALTYMPPVLILATRIAGALLFGSAVAGKLRHRTAFVGIVDRYRLVPEALTEFAAWTVIVLESLVVLSLVTGIALAVGGMLAIILLLGFAAAMAINIARGETEIDCGCFQTALRQRLSSALVVRNLLLALIFVPVLGGESRPLVALEWVDGVAAGIGLFIVNMAFASLLALGNSAESLRRRYA